VQLHATATHPNGSREDCTAAAQWTSTNGNVARFGFPGTATGEVYAYGLGSATVNATCGGGIGDTPIRVDVARVRGTVRSRSTLIPGAFVTQSATAITSITDGAGRFEFGLIGLLGSDEPAISAGAVGYETTRIPLTWKREAFIDADVDLPPVSGARLLQGRRDLFGSDQARFVFRTPGSGTLRLDTYFFYDYNDFLYIDLRCGSALEKSLTQRDHSMGRAFEVPARPDCTYELTFHQVSRYVPFTFDYLLTFVS